MNKYKRLLLNFLLCGINFFLLCKFLTDLPFPAATLMIYLVPVAVNILTIMINFRKFNSKDRRYFYILPFVSTLFYFLFGLFTYKQGIWSEFIKTNTKNIGEMTISVADSPIALSQIIFSMMLYIASAFLTFKIMEGKHDHSFGEQFK